MSVLDDLRGEFEKVMAELEARLASFESLAKGDETKLAAEVKDALELAKNQALLAVQKDEPMAAAAVKQALAVIEQQVLAILAQHVIG